jgi:hypothetical protein
MLLYKRGIVHCCTKNGGKSITMSVSSVSIDNPSAIIFKPFIAHSLDAFKHQEIGIHALSGNTPIIQIAKNSGVSRKFVYEQKNKDLQGVAQAFSEAPSKNNNEVLFTIPVTKKWSGDPVLVGCCARST